jgi:hypothetical protein
MIMKKLLIATAAIALAVSPAVAQTIGEQLDHAQHGAGHTQPTTAAPEPASIPGLAPTQAHHPEPAPGEWVAAPSLAGMPPIASEFDPALGMRPSWGTGAIAASAVPDDVGAFRMTCGAGDLAYVDPIVYPGTIGVSHLHQFFGLRAVRPDETYQSARAGKRTSTCGVADYALNRSAYWLPALLDGKGHVIQPNLVSIYYKRLPKSAPRCNWLTDPRGQAEACVDMPQGLRAVAGFDMQAPPPSRSLLARPAQGGSFYCAGPGASSTKADNLEAVLPGCPAGSKLYVAINFPNCWDGKNLDSPDHRSHLAYGSYGSWGYLRCPQSHPKLIPAVHVAAEYSIEAGDDPSLIRLASDEFEGLPRGKTLHGDFMPAWDPVAHRAFHENCIDKLLNCSGGDFGNGMQLRGAAQPSYGWINPNRLVPVPPVPGH